MAAQRRRFVIGCVWSDSGNLGDCDEVVVHAESRAAAVAKARQRWIDGNQSTAELTSVVVLKDGKKFVWRETPA